MLERDPQGLFHPAGEDEIRELVAWASAAGMPVRVRGTGHSIDEAIGTGAGEGVDLVLDRYTGVAFDDASRRVTVQGGCRLGGDPRDRSGRGKPEAGLCWQLERRGWALPVLAGVTHQTVAGFLMTGSAGGSRRHALTDQVVAMRLIDARGEVFEVSRDGDRELFEAAVVSLGLLGIVSTVTLRCVERFDVEGDERVVTADEALRDVDAFLAEHEYARMYWWPQPGVDRVSTWTARALPGEARGEPRPYRLLPEVAGSTVPAQAVAGTLIGAACRAGRWNRALAAAYRAFLRPGQEQRFRDAWWRTIPMDDALDERFFPSTWSELWLPAEATGEAVRRLRDHYRARGAAASGAYTVELYGAAASPFWLSPGHGRDSTRINICWHERGRGDPRQIYYPQFWDLLGDLGFRMHWAKHLFADPQRTAEHAAAAYPRFADFLELREQMDPGQVFVSDYWRAHLGIAARPLRAAPRPTARPRAESRSDGGRTWPLLFTLRPSDESYAGRAEQVVDVHATMDAEPGAIYDAIVNLTDARDWLVDFVRAEWVSGPDAEGRQVVDETFKTLTQRVRTLHADPGRRWLASWEACTWPLAKQLLEELDLTPLPDGRTLVRWRFHHEPFRLLRPVNGLLRAELEKTISESLRRLDRHLAQRPRAAAEPEATPAAV